jgi:hypothetical protein
MFAYKRLRRKGKAGSGKAHALPETGSVLNQASKAGQTLTAA